MNLLQTLILIFGATSIWMVGRTESWRKYGFLIGLLGQPLWYYMAWETQQWGVGAMCFFYTYSWASGVYHNFFKKPDRKIIVPPEVINLLSESARSNDNTKTYTMAKMWVTAYASPDYKKIHCEVCFHVIGDEKFYRVPFRTFNSKSDKP